MGDCGRYPTGFHFGCENTAVLFNAKVRARYLDMVSDTTQPATAELDVERSLSSPNGQLSCHWEIGNVAVNSEGCQPRAIPVLDTFMFVSLVCFCTVCFSHQSYLMLRKKTKEICNIILILTGRVEKKLNVTQCVQV